MSCLKRGIEKPVPLPKITFGGPRRNTLALDIRQNLRGLAHTELKTTTHKADTIIFSEMKSIKSSRGVARKHHSPDDTRASGIMNDEESTFGTSHITLKKSTLKLPDISPQRNRWGG